MNASLQFRLFSSLEAAGDCFHTCACSAIRVAELPSDAGPINWGGWYPLSADIQTLTAALSPDAILLVQGKRGDKPCRIRPPFGAIVVAPTNSLVTKTTTAGTTTTYQGQVVALAGTVVDDESKLILDEEEPEAAPIAAPAPVVQAAPAAQTAAARRA